MSKSLLITKKKLNKTVINTFVLSSSVNAPYLDLNCGSSSLVKLNFKNTAMARGKRTNRPPKSYEKIDEANAPLVS